MEQFYKIEIRINNGAAGVWIPVRAHSIGEAVVKADERCFGTPFTISGMTATEITEAEYLEMLRRPAEKSKLLYVAATASSDNYSVSAFSTSR